MSIRQWECPGRQRTGSQGAGKAQQEDEEVEQGRSHSSKVAQLWILEKILSFSALKQQLKH